MPAARAAYAGPGAAGMNEAYGVAGHPRTRLHSIRVTYLGRTQGWCGTTLNLKRGVWSTPTADQIVCRRCLHNQANQPGDRRGTERRG